MQPAVDFFFFLINTNVISMLVRFALRGADTSRLELFNQKTLSIKRKKNVKVNNSKEILMKLLV